MVSCMGAAHVRCVCFERAPETPYPGVAPRSIAWLFGRRGSRGGLSRRCDARDVSTILRGWTGRRRFERESGRYADGEARLGDGSDERQRQLTRMGNAAWGAGLSLLDAGGRRARVVRARGRALARELRGRRRPGAGAGRSARSRRSFSPATGAGAEEAAHWALVGGRGGDRVADRPLRGGARLRSARRLGVGAHPRRRASGSATTSRATSATRSR